MKISELTKQDLIRLISEHSSINQILKDIGANSNGSGAYNSFKNRCKKLGVEVPNYTQSGNFFGTKIKIPLEKILVRDSSYTNRSSLKKRLIKRGLLEYKCTGCGNGGSWQGKPLSLHLDHINGVNNDNRIGNLRLLCPNCHSQTTTYGGRSSGCKHL